MGCKMKANNFIIALQPIALKLHDLAITPFLKPWHIFKEDEIAFLSISVSPAL
ncbi:hypothetical protein SAMN04488601_101508 [Paenibacillus sp. 453mf]|nr:hypothetical protein SAMN04488601_101508 [Paenibacillus sp. 453mf]